MAVERATRQRDAIRSVIEASKRPLSPGEVLHAARSEVNALGLATVYRTLKLLVAEGTVQVITLPGETPRYEMAESAHHHHFQCNTCGRVDDVLRLDAFALEPESNVLVVGPAGCGKTTLLHLIAGLLLPGSGRVIVDGQDLSELSPPARDRFRGRHIGIVLQQFHLLPTLTAMQNLLVAQSIAGLPVDRTAAHGMLNALGVDERVDAYP